MNRRTQRRFWIYWGWVIVLSVSADRSATLAFPPEDKSAGDVVLLSALPQARFPAPRREDDRQAPKTLVGQVVDQQGNGLSEAVVHLKNKKTLAIKTHITDEKGSYRFVGLDRDSDYSVHAEYRGASSDTRTVSSFDDRREIYLLLEIDTSK